MTSKDEAEIRNEVDRKLIKHLLQRIKEIEVREIIDFAIWLNVPDKKVGQYLKWRKQGT